MSNALRQTDLSKQSAVNTKNTLASFKISKISGREFPQNPLQVSVSGAGLLAPLTPPPPQHKMHSAIPVVCGASQ